MERLDRGHIPFARLLMPCILGVVCAELWTPNPELYLWLHYGSGLMFLGCLICLIKITYFSSFLLGFLWLFCWTGAWASHPDIDLNHFSHHDYDRLILILEEEPQIRGVNVRAKARVLAGILSESGSESIPTRGYMQLSLQFDSTLTTFEDQMASLKYGSRILIPSDYTRIAPPLNPGEMDYASHMAKRDCWHQAFVNQQDFITMGAVEGNVLLHYAMRVRQQMVQKFEQYVEDPDAFAIASTLILGYRSDLSREIMEVFSATGTIHVLSVSGMHVVIVFWLLAKLLFWMDFHPKLKRLKFPLLLLAIWAYAVLTGLSPSVLRAAFMLSFVLWAEASGRHQRTYNSIGASAFILLLLEPKLLLDIGFQLSYLAVLGIVFLYPYVRKLLAVRYHLLKPLTDYSAMSIAAQAGAFPLAMFYFNQFPLYFLLANLVIVLPASLIMYIGFAVLIIPEATWTTGLLYMTGKILELLILYMNKALFLIQDLPAANLTGIEISLWQCVMIYLILLFASLALIQKSKFLFSSSLFVGLWLCAGLSYQYFEKWAGRQITIHQMRSALAISLTGRGQSLLITDLDKPDDRRLNYSVLPFLSGYGANDGLVFLPFGANYTSEDILIRDAIVQVGDSRMFIYTGGTWMDSYDSQTKLTTVDLLLVRQNPRKTLSDILEMIPSKKVLLDASNRTSLLKKMENEVLSDDIEVYNLKNNFAYVWVLDDD